MSVPVIELGGTHVTVALIADGAVTGCRRRPLDAALPAGDLIDALVAAAGGLAGPVWGVALPGPFEIGPGIARYTEDKFTSLYGVNLRDALGHRLKADVRFINDGDAFALGEWSRRGQTSRRLVGITLGTGVGSGWIADGRVVLAGRGVPPSGSAHLLQWEGVPLEETFSRRALSRASGAPDVLELCLAARDGERAARSVLASSTVALGRALAPYLRNFEADTVVVGGSIAGSWDLLGPWFADGAGVEAVVSVDDHSALLGAAVVVDRAATGQRPNGPRSNANR